MCGSEKLKSKLLIIGNVTETKWLFVKTPKSVKRVRKEFTIGTSLLLSGS